MFEIELSKYYMVLNGGCLRPHMIGGVTGPNGTTPRFGIGTETETGDGMFEKNNRASQQRPNILERFV